MTTADTEPGTHPPPPAPSARRAWAVMVVLGVAEMTATLDNSIVTIALPSAQVDLGFDDSLRSWVVTAYALAFGSLLLVGGRVIDIWGRRRSFVVGAAGFAAASALGGLAPDVVVLLVARTMQGACAALLAPAALALLSSTFPAGRDRGRAFGVFAALAVTGLAAGMIVGGLLTEYAGWRWCLLINVALSAIAAIGGRAVLPAATDRSVGRVDVIGAAAAVAGVFLLVLGLAGAEEHSWASARVAGPIVAGAVLVATFARWQRCAPRPLLPLRVVVDRRRGGGYLAAFTMVLGMFALVLLLSFVLQRQMGLSPTLTGLAFLPLVGGNLLATHTIGRPLRGRYGPAAAITSGLLAGAASLGWLSLLGPHASYAGDVLGPVTLMGIGMGCAVPTAFDLATVGLDPSDVGVGSATVSAMQQLGGSIGAALLSSVAGTVTAAAVDPTALTALTAVVHGFAVAFGVGAGLLVVGAVGCGLLLPWARAVPAREPGPPGGRP